MTDFWLLNINLHLCQHGNFLLVQSVKLQYKNDRFLVTNHKNSIKLISDPYVIFVTTDIYQQIVDATKAQYDYSTGQYTLPCDSKFQWKFTASGQEFIVDETNALLPTDDGQSCYLTLSDIITEPGIDIYLSLKFAKDYCIVYDVNGRIGLAKNTAK
jgi:hypothetical protein